MPRRRDERPRVIGPTWLKNQGYWRIVVVTPDAADPKKRKLARYYRDEADANEDANEARRLIERTRAITIEMAIDAYEQHLKEKETIGYAETIRRLRAFFPDHKMLIGRVTPERAKEWYDAFRERKIDRVKKDGTPRKDTGRGISASYHRAALINARSMMKFAKKEKQWITLNPFDEVEGVGKRKSGKRKPTGNELRAWFDFVWARLEARDWTALGVLMALSMALRSSDLTRRLVRDADFDCTQLNVDDGKSEASNEPRLIPDKLQPFVRELVAGRDPMEPLFKTPYTDSGHHTRRWLEEGMKRFCEGAGVPYFCPHALKGVSGTVIAKRGGAANVVMEHLSHEEDATTFRHYVDRAVVEQAQAEQVFKVIAGGRR